MPSAGMFAEVLLFRQLCRRMGLLFGRMASEGNREGGVKTAELSKSDVLGCGSCLPKFSLLPIQRPAFLVHLCQG